MEKKCMLLLRWQNFISQNVKYTGKRKNIHWHQYKITDHVGLCYKVQKVGHLCKFTCRFCQFKIWLTSDKKYKKSHFHKKKKKKKKRQVTFVISSVIWFLWKSNLLIRVGFEAGNCQLDHTFRALVHRGCYNLSSLAQGINQYSVKDIHSLLKETVKIILNGLWIMSIQW